MAFGIGTINSLGSAAQDLFSIGTHRTKAQGLRLESQSYDEAAGFADKNVAFTQLSTAIKQSQLDREIFKTMGGTVADVAGAGFATSGSALDILRDSAAQGALTKAVGAEQGLITEEGYRVEADNFRRMGEASRMAANEEDRAANFAPYMAGIHAAAALTSIFT